MLQVLAIFQEVGVNKMLYFMVFGESLLNGSVNYTNYPFCCLYIGIFGESLNGLVISSLYLNFRTAARVGPVSIQSYWPTLSSESAYSVQWLDLKNA